MYKMYKKVEILLSANRYFAIIILIQMNLQLSHNY